MTPGTRVRLTAPWMGLPVGSVGTVLGPYRAGSLTVDFGEAGCCYGVPMGMVEVIHANKGT